MGNKLTPRASVNTRMIALRNCAFFTWRITINYVGGVLNLERLLFKKLFKNMQENSAVASIINMMQALRNGELGWGSEDMRTHTSNAHHTQIT